MICSCCKAEENDVVENTAVQTSPADSNDGGDDDDISVYYDAVANLDDRQSMVASTSTSSPEIFHSAVGALHNSNRRRSTNNNMQQRQHRKSITQLLLLRQSATAADLRGGYPGHLTEKQLQICLDFRKQITSDDDNNDDNATRREIVFAFHKIENEAYAICRYLRAREFDIEATLKMIDGYIPRWKEGREHNFYPDFNAVTNHNGDESALLSQFPLVIGGLAKNGCLILYFTVKHLSLDGTECVANLDKIGPYMWYLVLQKYVNEVQKRQADDPTVKIRPVQVLVVADLDGLQLLTLRRAMPALQTALGILSVFPEFLYSVVICNVPRFFNAFWRIIKTFLDPSTANKFELYSKRSIGQKRLRELIHPVQLASNFGGTAISTDDLSLSQLEGYTRQIVHLVKCTPGGIGQCVVSITESENATINIYTKCSCEATFSIDSDTNVFTLKRTDKESTNDPYFREKVASLRGKGDYRATIKMGSNSSPSFFLVVVLVKEEETWVDNPM